ncbi:Stress responsive A/B Barrel Domain [Reichenbachiella agariperforans]|uniref:Stress responsive A/B Barrel Domain n=1 Tax=Reichenbachiella agariperforans TaxID=156994 RepID=A0A1M6UIQ4_REIAG|nr:Dabb family protein [Reichenbachiella agariperforans]SHK69030.1 Stress responsive A/B Barrel Domain [Reichenbachiella agariperforans]
MKSSILSHSIIFSLLISTTILCSCHSDKVETQKVLRHVVAFTFKEGVSIQDQTQAIQYFKALENKIPGLIKFEGGDDISVEGFSKGFTHCYILTFEDEAARDAYLPHPAHMEVVDKNKPLMADLLTLDFWGEEKKSVN